MDPRYEQKLRDEVIYLHSLWHQGPPRPATAVAGPHNLQPTQSTQFKKEKPKTGKKKSKNKPYNHIPDSNSSPGAEWLCPPSPPPPVSEWPSFPKQPDPKPSILLSPDEKSKITAKNAQQNAVKAAHKFFLENSHDDDSDDIDSSGSDEDDDSFMEERDGRKEYSFFYKLFVENANLREHYVKNFVQGEFSCLVCGAVGGKRTGKKYKSCLALVQHSVTISRTKRRQAHRAFGQAVCKVLGWDIDQLPTIVSLLSENKSGEAPVSVALANKESSMINHGGVVATSEAVVSLPSANISGDVQGNVNFDNKENSFTSIGNVDAVEGNNGGLVQESGVVSVLNEHTSDNNGVVTESGAIVSMPNEHTSDNNDGVVTESGAIVSMLNEHTSDDNGGVVTGSGAIVSMLNEHTSDNNGVVTEGGDERTSGEAHNVNFDKESSITSVCNVDSVEGTAGGILQDSGAIGTGISPTGGHEDENSLTSPDVGMTQPNNSEEPAAEGLIIATTDDNNGVGNGMHDLQMDDDCLIELSEDYN